MFVIPSTVEHFSLFSSDIYSVYVLPFFYSIYPLSLFPDDAQYVIAFENLFVSSFYTSTHLKLCPAHNGSFFCALQYTSFKVRKK